MRNKGRFEYVDQMRKISTIEKMGAIESLYPVDFQQQKIDNNKFIRYKEEVALDQLPKKQNYLFNNDIITAYKEDVEPQCNQRFSNNIDNITTDTNYFKNWSDTLNVEIKKRDYEHRFYFQNAQPPPRLKQEGKDKSKKDDDSAGQGKLKTKQDKQGKESGEEDTNLDLPQRQKYNFSQINKNLYMKKLDKDDLEGNGLAKAGIKNQIVELRKLKNLQQIQKLNGFQQQFNKFSYYIDIPENKYEIDFIDNSIVRGNNNLTIDYFRDIGIPSRDIVKYTIKNYNKMKSKDDENENIQHDNIYNQEKRQLLYLYFLKEQELKINKNDINFEDVTNFSMGRITSMNAHMCVRNQKVTKAQYLKLLKKMEKYDMRENQGSKAKNDIDVGTEDLQDLQVPHQGEKKVEQKIQNLNIEKIIQQINCLKKEVRLFEQKNNNCNINKQNFYNEVYTKVESMLNILYSEVVDKMSIKYPLSQIRDHIHQIQGKNQLGYDRMRLLWYIASCYDEMLSKQPKKIDLRNMADIKQRQTPIITTYKGQKVISQDPTQTKKLFGFNNTNGKSNLQKTPTKNVTPSKGTKGQAAVTPTKSRLTQKKKDVGNTTASSKKWPTTAKK